MNLSKLPRTLSRYVTYMPKRNFGGAGHKDAHGHGAVAGHGEHDAHHHEHHHAPRTDIPSDAEVAKYDHLFPGPTKRESTFALHNIVSKLPLTRGKGFVEFLANNFGDAKSESNTERFIPPQVHENSVFLYQSKDLANAVRKLRATEIAAAFFVGAVMHQPLFVIPTFAAYYFIHGNALYFELSRRLVTRMDLLPHLEMIQVQKVSVFGIVYSKLIRIDDLEKVEFEEDDQKYNYFWYLNKTNVDPQMIFRVKSTGEYLCFDRDGFWDWKGISHDLLN